MLDKNELCRELQLDGNTADQILALIAGDLHPADIEAVTDRLQGYRILKDTPEDIMFAIDVLIEGCDVDYIYEPSEEFQEDFERTKIAAYSNTGDMYSPTILYLYETGEYVLATQGDYTLGA